MATDKGPPNLSNLPREIFGHVLNVVDYKSLIRLRKVCHTSRSLIHHLKPDIHCVQLNLVVSDSGVSQELIFDPDDDGSIIWIEYHEEDPNGCALVFEDSIKILPNRSCYDVFEEDSEMVWCHLKSELQELNVKFYGGDLERFLGFLKQNLKNLKNSGSPLRLKSLVLELVVPEERQILEILEQVDPGSIETLSIKHRLDRHQYPRENVLSARRLMKTEQWDRARVLETKNVCWMEPLHEFGGFDRVVTKVEEVNPGQLVDLIAKLTNSSTFESYKIAYRTCQYSPAYLNTPIPSDQIIDFFKKEIIEIHEDNNRENRELGILDEDRCMTGIEFIEHLKKHFTRADWWDGIFEDPWDGDFRVEEYSDGEELEEKIAEDLEEKSEEMEENLEKNAEKTAKNDYDYGSDKEYEGIPTNEPGSSRNGGNETAESAGSSRDEKAGSSAAAEKDDITIEEVYQSFERAFGGFSKNGKAEKPSDEEEEMEDKDFEDEKSESSDGFAESDAEKSDDEEEEIENEESGDSDIDEEFRIGSPRRDDNDVEEDFEDDDDASSISSEEGDPQELPPPEAFPGMVWFFKMQSQPDLLLCVKHCKWENIFYFQLFPKKQAPFYAIIHDLGKMDEEK